MKDIAGQRFGRLVALEPTEKRVRQLVVWRCRCDCGNICEVPSSSLIKGNTRSCGCLARGTRGRDLTGQRFGRLTVTRPVREPGRRTAWECRCDCGNTCTVIPYQLTSGRTRSCGCLRVEANRNDLAGQRFGRLTAVKPAGKRHGYILWECLCDCGNAKLVTSQQLRSGKTRSCGCLAKQRPGKDLSGRRFGNLTAVRRVGSRDGYALWECACDCGNACMATSHDLTGGQVKSCGCQRPEIGVALGRRFGKLVAVDRVGEPRGADERWRCLCDCGRVVVASAGDLAAGRVASCADCRTAGRRENRHGQDA